MLAPRFSRSGVGLAVLLLSCGARTFAQEPRFKVSVSTGNASPPFVFQGPQPPRAPVPFFESTDKQDLWLTGVDVRAYWMKRLSVVVQASFGNEPSGHFAFVQPPIAPTLPTFSVDEIVKH